MTHATLTALEERLDSPSARGLAHAVSATIRDGLLIAGDRLPPIRTVAAELALSPTTVSAAWGLLARSGTVTTDGRRGTTVLDQRAGGTVRYHAALDRPSTFDHELSTGVPDPDLLPDLGRALAGLRTAPTTGSYLDDPVLPDLASVLLADWPFAVDEVAVVDGAMDAMDLFVRTQLRFGDRVVVEDPGFPPLVDLLESVGVQLVGVAVDGEGLDPDALEAALSMSARRGAQIAGLLSGRSTLVVEDDSAAHLSPSPLVSLGQWRPEQTMHVRSFSKSHGPDLRLAALSAPAPIFNAINGRRQLGQGWSSRLLQQVLLGLLTDDVATAQVGAAARTYAARRAHVVGRLHERGVEVGGTEGINIWVPVQDETAAVVRLASQGIGVAPGTPFRIGAGGEGGHIRVTVGLASNEPGALDSLADSLADAARTSGWNGRAR